MEIYLPIFFGWKVNKPQHISRCSQIHSAGHFLPSVIDAPVCSLVIAVRSSVSDPVLIERFKWDCVRDACSLIWKTSHERFAKRCHGDKCAGDGVNPNLLKALSEINGCRGSGVAHGVSCFPLWSSLIAIKSCFTFWSSTTGPVLVSLS